MAKSPSGGVGRVVPAEPLDPVHLVDSRLAEALAHVGELGGAAAQRAGHAGRAGDVGRGQHQIEMEGQERRRAGRGVEDHRAAHRLVADEEVVVDLHDDQAPGRKGDTRSLGEVVHPVARGPEAEQWDLGQAGDGRVRQRSLTEARPALADFVVPLGRGRQRRWHEVQRGVMDLVTAGEELAGDDVRVLLDVGVQQCAVVVVGRAGGLVGLVGVRHLEDDARTRQGRPRGRGRGPGHTRRHEDGGGHGHHREENDSLPWKSHGGRLSLRRIAGSDGPGPVRPGAGSSGAPDTAGRRTASTTAAAVATMPMTAPRMHTPAQWWLS